MRIFLTTALFLFAGAAAASAQAASVGVGVTIRPALRASAVQADASAAPVAARPAASERGGHVAFPLRTGWGWQVSAEIQDGCGDDCPPLGWHVRVFGTDEPEGSASSERASEAVTGSISGRDRTLRVDYRLPDTVEAPATLSGTLTYLIVPL